MAIERTDVQTEFSLIILAGGKSSRMGQDKCYLKYKGKTFLEIQIDIGRELGIKDIMVSGMHLLPQDVRSVPDHIKERGPLGGLEACLWAAKNRKCIVVCADNPLLTADALQKLMKAADQTEALVIACEHHEKQEPLTGIYDTALADEILDELQNRKGSVFAFLRRVGCMWINMDEYEECFFNINRPEDYEKIKNKP